MVRRLFWIGVGVWAALRVQKAAEQVTPSGLLDHGAGAVRHVLADVRAALREGRRTTKEVEASLHAQAGHHPLRAPAIDVEATSRNPPGEILGRR